MPSELTKVEKKIDDRFSVLLKTTGDDAAEALAELRKSTTARLNTLSIKIGELEKKLKSNESQEEEDDTEEVDIDKLIAEKIDKINLPRMIQKELDEIAETEHNDIDRLVTARIDKFLLADPTRIGKNWFLSRSR